MGRKKDSSYVAPLALLAATYLPRQATTDGVFLTCARVPEVGSCRDHFWDMHRDQRPTFDALILPKHRDAKLRHRLLANRLPRSESVVHEQRPPPRKNGEMSSQETLTFNQAVRGITEFIEVAIHTILYVRQIYPADLFVRRKKYETPVYQSRHPGLNEYVAGAVKAIGDELVLGNVEKVVVVIKDKDEVALERFIFAIQTMIAAESFNKDTSVEGAMATVALGQYFRSFMVKLGMIESQLAELPRDGGGENTFAIVLELQEDKAPSAMPVKDDPPPWLPAVTQHTTSGASEKAQLHMVRAVDTGVVNLSLAVQESADKLRILADLESKSKGGQIPAQGTLNKP